ncbi:hypothetical protein BD626DRAFT_569537 [Schizophyllum amplum]|uniref:Uncharacterized protein n=1 Tax=Schizophyllum amplum TaxID=97359 RepID=A0A550CDU5_9AGAR|nr:hypothetical protein BD626DRAFT_569537 [Auriculariopsis ampla]
MAGKKAACKRPKKPKGIPGPKSKWATPAAQKLFRRYQDVWLEAAQRGQAPVSRFYERMRKLYCYHFVNGPTADTTDTTTTVDTSTAESDSDEQFVDEDPDVKALEDWEHNMELSDEELEERQKRNKRLYKYIGKWFRSHMKASRNDGVVQILDDITRASKSSTRPRRKRLDFFIQRQFYDQKIRKLWEPEWEKRSADMSVKDKKREELRQRNKYCMEWYNGQDDATKQAIQRALDTANELELQAHERDLTERLAEEGQQNAEGYAEAFLEAGSILIPLVNWISRNFGCVSSIWIACPIPEKGGRIECRSVHAGRTRDMAQQLLPEADVCGMMKIEETILDFAKRCFST